MEGGSTEYYMIQQLAMHIVIMKILTQDFTRNKMCVKEMEEGNDHNGQQLSPATMESADSTKVSGLLLHLQID